MSELLYTQEQMLRTRNENYIAGKKDGEQSLLTAMRNSLRDSRESLRLLDGVKAYELFVSIFQAQLNGEFDEDKENN